MENYNVIVNRDEINITVRNEIIDTLSIIQRIKNVEDNLADGIDGKDGTNGIDGQDGLDGTNGMDGLSAYQIAISNGFEGNESDWLESLKGKDGIDGLDGINGTNGTDGQDGIDGNDGNDGLSAYQIAINNGYEGNEQQWLESLKGIDGQDGMDGNDGLSAEIKGFRALGGGYISYTLNMSLINISDSSPLQSGNLYLIPFYIKRQSDITGFVLHQNGGNSTYTSNGDNGISIYRLDDNGNYELVISNISTNSFKNIGFGSGIINFSPSIILDEGIYFAGIIFNASVITTPPTIAGNGYSELFSYTNNNINNYHMTGVYNTNTLPTNINRDLVSKNEFIYAVVVVGNPL
ncbi:hypothetical protein MM236_01175 [Belliella sp. DSM 107340]|uniref:Collagen triple helix repeat-containing protein n=1 Tax=Belliella calami TaxID=2923436 RepID=A0ABS9UIX6_9BACT|nr:hypothetical protein [Belliella calami]MCH7396573.1 hypothetical protein [Belliella calami]